MAFYYGIHNVAQYLMSAFGAKADMPIALHMSAFDPKRTSGDLFRHDGEVLLSVRFGG